MIKKRYIILSTITGIFLTFFLIMCQPAEAEKTAEKVQNLPVITTVDSSGNVGQHTSIDVEGTYVYISYQDVTNTSLKFARSSDNGATWPASSIRTIDAAGSVGYFSSITAEGSNVYIAYYDATNQKLNFARSTDRGATWPVEEIKVVDEYSDNVGRYCKIAAEGTNVYIVYNDDINFKVKFAKSTDSGVSWPEEAIKVVDETGLNSEMPSIAANSSYIYVSFYYAIDQDLRFIRSTTGGETWVEMNRKEVDIPGYSGLYNSVTFNGLNVYISYHDGYSDGNLKFARSTSRGVTWTEANIKTVDSAGDIGQYTSIEADEDNVMIAYFDSTNRDLKFARSADSGATWLPENITVIDSEDSVGEYCSTALSGSNVYVSYYDATNKNLKFAKSIDLGATW